MLLKLQDQFSNLKKKKEKVDKEQLLETGKIE